MKKTMKRGLKMKRRCLKSIWCVQITQLIQSAAESGLNFVGSDRCICGRTCSLEKLYGFKDKVTFLNSFLTPKKQMRLTFHSFKITTNFYRIQIALKRCCSICLTKDEVILFCHTVNSFRYRVRVIEAKVVCCNLTPLS